MRESGDMTGACRGTVWLVLALLMVLGGVAGCSRREPDAETGRAGAPGTIPAAEASADSPVGDDFRASMPREGGPEGYVGSESCRACHEKQFDSWHRTFHRTMTQYATPQTVRASFDGVTLTNDSTRFLLSREGEELRVRMERIREPGVSPGETPAVDTRVSLVTGSHHMQVFWVPGGDGNVQVGFPFTWLIPEARWVPRNSTFIRPPGFAHQPEVWNVMCSRCHATAIEPRVDPAARVMDSRAAELGISCEACHGPGQKHVELRKAAGERGGKPEAAALRGEIVHPEGLDPVRASQVCGFCHSMKWIDRSENWRQDGFRYRPGDDLSSTTPLIQPKSAESLPGLREYLERNPNLLHDYFWPDGMIRVSGREYNGLVESPCAKGGRFSCLSCHSLHDSEPSDLLARNRTDNQACTQCHEAYREPEALARHTHHGAGLTGSECYNCHMPHTTYGVLSAIRSHQVSSPRVADELTSGRPNACNLCHLDRTLKWTADVLARWYRQPVVEIPADRETVADAVHLALSGDAGQRALMAWHLGWEPARRASGAEWIAPVLGVLLDDPYAAVRCVAERSLRTTPSLVPAGYDYVTDPATRAPAREAVWSAWMAGSRPPAGGAPLPSAVVVGPGTVESIAARVNPFLERRNNRPMRLRE